jgi:membrane protein DedA with SNARE-associated domain
VGTIPKVLALFLIGFYVGQSYIKINGYLHYIALITIGLAFLVLIYFIISKKLKKSLLEE